MLKTKLYLLIEKGKNGSKINLWFDYSIMILIMLNVIAIVFETVKIIQTHYNTYFRVFELFSVIIFTFEYLVRIYVSDLTHPSNSRLKSALKFVLSGYGLIDLIAIIPFYLPFIIKLDLRFIRILRVMRFLRLLKLNRYNSSLNLIWDVFREKKTELTITVFLTFMILLIASFLMYYVEGDVQPDKFSNVFECFWWAIATLTTVGYGDVYPITALGKIISGFIAILGIGLVALPTGLVSAGFLEKINKKKQQPKRCPHCGKEID
ncbi:MAG: ion transporter [Bacteroidales bacterium]